MSESRDVPIEHSTISTLGSRVVTACRRPAASPLVLAAFLFVACGGSGGGDDGSQILFTGPASALLPHEVGLTRRFSIRVERGGEIRTTTVTRRVVASEPATAAGTPFVIETLDAMGLVEQSETYQDRQSEITVAEIRFDPGTPDARSVTLPPDTIRYRTPVIAGDEVRSPLALTLDLDIVVAGQQVSKTVLFDATVIRTPRALASIQGSDGQPHEAIRFATASAGQSSLTVAGVTLRLAMESQGEELVVPGTGMVSAVEEVEIRTSVAGGDRDGQVRVRIETQALGDS